MMSATNPEAEGRNIPRRYDIDGAPFHIGAMVKVTSLTDPDTFSYIDLNDDCEIEDILIGSVGIVAHYDYDCGCGQVFPDQPMIGITFTSGILKGQTHEMWPEELIAIYKE